MKNAQPWIPSSSSAADGILRHGRYILSSPAVVLQPARWSSAITKATSSEPAPTVAACSASCDIDLVEIETISGRFQLHQSAPAPSWEQRSQHDGLHRRSTRPRAQRCSPPATHMDTPKPSAASAQSGPAARFAVIGDLHHGPRQSATP